MREDDVGVDRIACVVEFLVDECNFLLLAGSQDFLLIGVRIGVNWISFAPARGT